MLWVHANRCILIIYFNKYIIGSYTRSHIYNIYICIYFLFLFFKKIIYYIIRINSLLIKGKNRSDHVWRIVCTPRFVYEYR